MAEEVYFTPRLSPWTMVLPRSYLAFELVTLLLGRSRERKAWALTSPFFSPPGIPASNPAERGRLSGEGPHGGECQGVDTWAGPFADCSAAVCLASPGAMLRGCPGVGGAPTPLAADSLQPLEASLSCERTMPGGCEEDSASGPYSPSLSACSKCPSCLPASSCQGPGLEPVENPFPSIPGSLAAPALAPHWALSAEAGWMSNWVRVSSWQ